MTKRTNLEKNGAAQAAFLGCMLGCLTLALVNLGTEVSEAFKNTVHYIGKLSMPGAEGIGPYSGKETLSLGVWLGSWFTLHRILRTGEWNSRLVYVVFLVGMAIATTLLWPPVIHWTAHLLTGS
ncbi:MAG: hypothetical protein HY447_03555 [Candidatus Omnitrophica bacterium]|nr:hypothetical protein [Candidatus Omnitrophota bacterium]